MHQFEAKLFSCEKLSTFCWKRKVMKTWFDFRIYSYIYLYHPLPQPLSTAKPLFLGICEDHVTALLNTLPIASQCNPTNPSFLWPWRPSEIWALSVYSANFILSPLLWTMFLAHRSLLVLKPPKALHIRNFVVAPSAQKAVSPCLCLLEIQACVQMSHS